MKSLSQITETFTESVIREMTRISDSCEGINMSQGFPDFESPEAIRNAAIEAINNHHNQYPITFGEKELREAIALKAHSYNKINCNPINEITVTCGATEAMIATLKAIINPGDEIIIFEPFYENYGPDGILSGAKPCYVKLHAPDWKYNIDELRKAFNKNTKAIIINTPNNPTGKVFSKNELSEIAQLCIEWDVYAITDEIYEHILYDGSEHISLATLPGMKERTITINSISKTYSVTGWRVGWAIASAPITERIRKVHDFLTVGAPTPLQHAAVHALNFSETYYQGLQKKYLTARAYMLETLNKVGFKSFIPKGAYYIMADAENLFNEFKAENDYDFAKKLIEKTRVATVPGFSFYKGKNTITKQVRFAFCKKPQTLEMVRNLFETHLK